MDLVETERHFVLRADLPGLTEEDVNIEVEDRVLTVSGERKAEHEASEGRLPPRGARVRLVLALADAARGRQRRGRRGRASTAACSRSGSRSPSSASRARSRSASATRRRRSTPTPPRRATSHAGAANVAAPVFSIRTRDPGSYARTGTLKLAHGEVRTPAFVPLATKAVVKTLEVREAGDLGFDMVLGNTFHLFLSPGHELIEQLGGLHRFQRWDRPIITDSGGFQVFSMGHGTVADEIKGRAAQFAGERAGAILAIEEEGVRFRSYLDGSTQVHGARDLDGGPGRAAAPTSRSCSTSARRSTPTATTPRARPSAPTAGWTAACAWHAAARARGPDRLRDRPGRDRRGPAPRVRAGGRRRATALGGIAIGGSLGEDKAQMFQVVEWTIEELPEAKPRHLLGIGEVDDLVRGVELGIDTFDCAMPTRIGRHGMAIVPDPEQRWRVDLAKARWKRGRRAAARGLPVPGLRRRLLARLPALPAQGQGADRDAPAHDPQPRLPAAPDGRAARRDRRGPPAGRGRRGARGRRAVGARGRA